MNLQDFSPAYLLAAGGVFALLASFWDRVQKVVHSISKIAVYRAHLDFPTSMDMARLLRAEYKTWSWSDVYFYCLAKAFIDEHMSKYVPFKLPPGPGIYRGKRGWFWVSPTSSTMVLACIKGTVDFEGLVSDALDFDLRSKTGSKQNRFYVEKVIGSEKGAWAMGAVIGSKLGGASSNNGRVGNSDKTSQEPVSSDSTGPMSRVYEDLDTSFKYDRKLYTRQGNVDPFRGLFYAPDVLAQVEEAKAWLRSGQWYADRNIPWRRGLLVHGPGGTGKSSLAKAMAQTMGIPLIHFYLNTLSDQEFIKEWGNLAAPCVVLFEDIDNVFHGRVPQTEHKSLTFDCVLNQISGVTAADGLFLIITTNDISKIDPALGVAREGQGGLSTRPGRIDRVLYLGTAPAEQRREIIAHILRDWPELVEDMVEQTADMTPVQVQETCRELAYRKLNEVT